MIDVLVKRDLLQYVQDARPVRGMGCVLSDHYVILCKFRLVGAWIKWREVVVGLGKTGNGGKCKRSMWHSESWGKEPSVWWNDEIKAAVRRKEAAWKRLLAACDE